MKRFPLSRQAEQLLLSVDTEVKWDVVEFFFQNPGARVSIEVLSSFLARDSDDVRIAVRQLREASILENANGSAVSLTSSEDSLIWLDEIMTLARELGSKFSRTLFSE